MIRCLAAAAFILALPGDVPAQDPPVGGTQLVLLDGDALRVIDLETAAATTVATGISHYSYDPAKRRLLFADLETVHVSDLAGEKKRLLQLAKIVHPGCRHVESAINDIAFCDGGATVMVRYREVPEGVDPHEPSDAQMKVVALATDGSARSAVERPATLLSDPANRGLPDFSPDGTRSIVSLSKQGPDDSFNVELREHDGRGGGVGKEIARFPLPTLTYLRGRWSPDGTLYAFMTASITYGRHEIRTWDGKTCRTIAKADCGLGLGGTGEMLLDWSPEGRRLVILPKDRANGPEVQVLDVGGAAAATFDAGSDPLRPVFIPGSRKLALLDYSACPRKTQHQHRFAACRLALKLLDPDAEGAGRSRELAAGEQLAAIPPVATPDGKELLVFTVASEKVPPGEWAEATERRFGMKVLDLETGKAREALKGLVFSGGPLLVRIVKK